MNTNSGDYNSGDFNAGDYNVGNFNTGDYNSGNRNTGIYNAGNYNSGDCNSGSCNTGDYNSGDYNVGDWNSGNYSNGCFNTENSKIYMFNKPSSWTYDDWLNSRARYILTKCPSNVLTWISENNMTANEKEQHPEYSTTGRFWREIEKESKRQERWNNLSDEDKDAVMSLPNFDKEIFKEITGIDVEG